MSTSIRSPLPDQFRCGVTCLIALILVDFTQAQKTPSKNEEVGKNASPAKDPKAELLPWLTSKRQARAEALRNGKPILVRAGAEWCGWCKKFDEELADKSVQKELENWTLWYLDIDQSAGDAKTLAIGGVPALRLLTADGNIVQSQDGFIKAAEFLAWLTKHREEASVKPVDELFETGDPTGVALVRIVRELGQRDPVLREAAIRRLAGSPQTSAPSVVRVLGEGSLQAKLAAVDLLKEWKAPGADDLDPWRPESLAAPKIQKLKEWAPKAAKATSNPQKALTSAEIAAANKDIDLMLVAKEEAVAAIRERLARHGKALLPTLYERLKKVESDSDRQRLTSLRYRLAASSALSLKWRDGLDRLSAIDVKTRHQAADELVRQASASDEDLLLELFSDPDPLVREISLRGLFEISGGAVTEVLARLLNDPDSNVRAAILKIMTENPAPSLTATLSDYVKKEKDADLVVHAARALREISSDAALKTLIQLLKHESWRVRAESAEGLAKKVDRHQMYGESNNDKHADIFAAMIEVLDDSDGFVVGQAIKALKNAPLESAVDPLVKAATKHPEMTGEIVAVLANNSSMKSKAIPHLRKFCKSENMIVRAAAITGLCDAAANPPVDELRAALQDSESKVRIAAAASMALLMNKLRPSIAERYPFGSTSEDAESGGSSAEEKPTRATAGSKEVAPKKGIGGILGSLFSDAEAPTKREKVTKTEIKPKDAVAKTKTDTKAVAERSDKPTSDPKKSSPAKELAKEAAKAEKTPIKSEPPESKLDAWLAKLAKGKEAPEWMLKQRDLLEKMLSAPALEERLQGAKTLIVLGDSEKALPVLKAAAASDPKLIASAAEILIWQPWKSRLELFLHLAALKPPAESQDELVKYMLQPRDDRAIEFVWRQIAASVDRPEVATHTAYNLLDTYFAGNYYDANRLPAKTKKRIVQDLLPRAQSGSEWQRVIAISLLFTADKEAASELAEKILADPKESASLRGDAFQIVLMSSESESQSRKRAVEALKSSAKELHDAALMRLALGGISRGMLRDSIYLYGANSFTSASSSAERAMPEPPKGLKAEMLRPIVDSGSPKSAALAGYLLVLLDDRSGFDPLLRYWRKHASTDPEYQKLVYQSISRIDDDSLTPILEGIYNRYDRNRGNYEIAGFYWTIRTMEGPRAKALRSRIRKEVGMENLR